MDSSLVSVVTQGLGLCFMVLVLAAAIFDLWLFKIPNLLTGTLALLFVPQALLLLEPTNWLIHLGVGLGAFVVGALAFRFNLMGGGDVKLLAAVGLWIGWTGLPQTLLLIGLIGGLLTIVLLLLRRFEAPLEVLLTRISVALPMAFRTKQPVPYGVAIAAGTLIVGRRLEILGCLKGCIG